MKPSGRVDMLDSRKNDPTVPLPPQRLPTEPLRTQTLRTFQSAAHAGGFVELRECADGSALWLRKSAADTDRDTHQRMCIDSLTHSATVFWIGSLGKLNSKTFREVPALQEWFKSKPEAILER